MLNNRKIRIMTKLAIYETKKGKEDIYLSKYYKTDYVRLNALKTVICTTIAYLLILALVVLYRSEYLIKNAVKLDYRTIGTYVLGIYILIIAIYGLGAVIGYSLKYDASRKKLARYYKILKRLNKIYKEETPES